MEKEFIITSTNSIEGGKITKYFGVINNNVVVGTNLFSDIGASFLDIFGGNSSSYQKKLKDIYDTSIQNLKVKARELGANGILSLSIDFDEISGGGKSMFMISVSGTAVLIKHSTETENLNFDKNSFISNDILKNELTKNQIITKIENKKSLTQEDWYFLHQNSNSKISEKVLNRFINSYGDMTYSADSNSGKNFLNNVSNYFSAIEREEAIEILYPEIFENSEKIVEIIRTNQLFSPEKILEVLKKGEFKIAINYLNIDKKNYSKDDLSKMIEIIEHFDKLEDKGSIKATKSLLGKDKEKYICPNGHSNEITSEFCETHNCSQNIKGLTKTQVEKINEFKNKVETLRYLLNKN